MAISNTLIDSIFTTLTNNEMLFIDTDMYNLMSTVIDKYKNDQRVQFLHANLFCTFKWNRNELSIVVCDQYQYIKDGLSDVLADMVQDIRNANIPYIKRVHFGDGDNGTIYVDIDPNYFKKPIYANMFESMEGKKDEEIRITG